MMQMHYGNPALGGLQRLSAGHCDGTLSPQPNAWRPQRVTSKLHMLSQFVADIHEVGREADANVAEHGLERLRAMLGFDCAWYGWARMLPDRTTVHASSTINLPDGFAGYWSTVERQDLVARALRHDRQHVALYDRHQPSQTDGMIDLSERYHLKKWAAVIHNRPNRTTTFFASIYRTSLGGRQWDAEDLQLLQCAIDHIFLAMQASVKRDDGEKEQATLVVDPEGFAQLGLEESSAFLRTLWPGWSGERLPEPLRGIARQSGTHTLKAEGVVVSCERDQRLPSQLMRLKLSRLSKMDRLSPREQQVAQLLAAGATHKKAAQALGSAPATIRNQTQTIYEKLGISSRAELVELVLRRGRATARVAAH